MPIVLTIAGSDPSGGAGIQADIKTISALGAYAAATITALTVQNTQGVSRCVPIDAELVYQQAKAVLTDMAVDAIKIGMLATKENVAAVTRLLQEHPTIPVVCDPVILSTSGHPLLSDEALQLAKNQLFPLCTIITPNIPEAERIFGRDLNPSNLSSPSNLSNLSKESIPSLLIKGGHAESAAMTDTLYHAGKTFTFSTPKIATSNLHGTGCTLSTAIATFLAKQIKENSEHSENSKKSKNPENPENSERNRLNLPEAVRAAKAYTTACITAAAAQQIGHGNGPLWHFPENIGLSAQTSFDV